MKTIITTDPVAAWGAFTGSLAIIISILSYRLAQKAQRASLSIVIRPNMVSFPPDPSDNNTYTYFEIFNGGLRDVCIERMGWDSSDGTHCMFNYKFDPLPKDIQAGHNYKTSIAEDEKFKLDKKKRFWAETADHKIFYYYPGRDLLSRIRNRFQR